MLDRLSPIPYASTQGIPREDHWPKPAVLALVLWSKATTQNTSVKVAYSIPPSPTASTSAHDDPVNHVGTDSDHQPLLR